MIFNRIEIEKRENEMLSPFAAKSENSKGRVYSEEKDFWRSEFQRDRDRIIHSKAFRRLMHKTQVFLAPEEDHYRTRLTHTIEVSQIARTIARGLGLNEDLTEAIALGHDLGHTPFGHSGESVLNEIHPGGFKHNIQSVRVVEVLERGRKFNGMNLTFEVRDGIKNHTGIELPKTLEGQIVKISDRIAYINHDIDDAIRSGVIDQDDLPKSCLDVLGYTHRQRINFLVEDMINSSRGQCQISQSPTAAKAMNDLRGYMFRHVYKNEKVKSVEDLKNVEKIVKDLYFYFKDDIKNLPNDMVEIAREEDAKQLEGKGAAGIETAAKDYVAGMTDRFAINKHKELFG